MSKVHKDCAHCGITFFVESTSERRYCCSEHSRLAQSLKMSEIGKRFDTSKARASITDETHQKQRMTQLGHHRVHPATQWFANTPMDLKERLRKLMALRANPIRPPHTGPIHRYGLRFHVEVEVFFYEEMMRRKIATEREPALDGWCPDFWLPQHSLYVEVKSWYTAEEQGYRRVVGKFRDDVLFVEDSDVWGLSKVGEDIVPHLRECSNRFCTQLSQCVTDSAA